MTRICGHPGTRGGSCGLILGHAEPHLPVCVLAPQAPVPVRPARRDPADDWEYGRDAMRVTFARCERDDPEAG
jgi:hypothetical protein